MRGFWMVTGMASITVLKLAGGERARDTPCQTSARRTGALWTPPYRLSSAMRMAADAASKLSPVERRKCASRTSESMTSAPARPRALNSAADHISPSSWTSPSAFSGKCLVESRRRRQGGFDVEYEVASHDAMQKRSVILFDSVSLNDADR